MQGPANPKGSIAGKGKSRAVTGTLRSFEATAPGLTGSALVGVGGLPVASLLPGAGEERRGFAKAAAMLSMGELTPRQISHFWIMARQVSLSSLMARLVSCLWYRCSRGTTTARMKSSPSTRKERHTSRM